MSSVDDLTGAIVNGLLQKGVIRILDGLKMSHESYDINVVISAVQVRNMLIRNEYIERRQCGEKAEMLYCVLAERYGLTYRTVDEVCHGRR